MNDHVTKPIDPDALTRILLKWMPGKPVRGAGSGATVAGALLDDSCIPEELAPFDIQAALRRIGGKRELLRKTMLSFAAQYADAGSHLRQLIHAGETEEAQRLAHSLKGIARTLEAIELGDAASAIENALRGGRQDLPGTAG